MTYTGHMVDSLTQLVEIAESNAIPKLTPITTEVKRIQFCPKCNSPMIDGIKCCVCADRLRDQILAAMKRDAYYEETDEQGRRRCLECKEFQHIVKGTDHCAECLKKIDEEEL